MWGLPRLSGIAASFLLAISMIGVVPAGAQAYARTQAQAVAGETELYVDQSSSSCSNPGPGSQTVPFCSIQAAANVVDPGQTVYIETAGEQNYDENVTITRSGTPLAPITFARLGTELLPDIYPYTNGGLPITLRNVHDVSLYFLAVDHSNGSNGIEVIGSSDITLDRVRDADESVTTSTAAGVTVDGASSDVTISRAEIIGPEHGYGDGVRVQPGARGVTMTTNEITMDEGMGIALNDATGGAVTSNTVSQFCGAGVSLTGGSSAVAENNIIDMYGNGGCAPPGAAISVDQESAGTVRADYNALYVKGSNTEYSWAGTSYADAAAFNAATGQGGRDLDLTSAIKLTPPAGSPVIDSADCTAPGELTTDFLGNPRVRDPLVTGTGVGTCYADRGAFELQDSLNPTPSAITPSSLQGPVPFDLCVTLSAPATSGWRESVSYTIDFGDGSGPVQVAPASTTSHTYTTPGQYTLNVTAADTGGSTQTYQRQVAAET